MKLRGTKMSGYSIKDGRVVKRPKKISVSQRLRQKSSKRIRPKKGPRI